MPASPLRVRVSLQRACPACGVTDCADPAECLHFLVSRPWGDCDRCAGSGWAGDSDPTGVFCGYCAGSGLTEYTPASVHLAQSSESARQRHAAYVAALRERVASLAPASLADLSGVALIVALHASDYIKQRDPDLDKVAAFMADGVERLGMRRLHELVADLLIFWGRCTLDIVTAEDWAAHRVRFDFSRLVNCSYIVQRRFGRIRKILAATDREAVAA
ncbi:hypothetical protein ACWEL8_01640 [Streptomyces sp. NPDC004690]